MCDECIHYCYSENVNTTASESKFEDFPSLFMIWVRLVKYLKSVLEIN